MDQSYDTLLDSKTEIINEWANQQKFNLETLKKKLSDIKGTMKVMTKSQTFAK